MSQRRDQLGEQSPDALPKCRHLTPHLIVLSVCAAILISAVLLSLSETGEGYLTIGSLPVPDTCTFKKFSGIPCPGCGLTRSMVAAAHGDLMISFHYHRLGLVTLIYVLLQFIYRVGAITAPALTVRTFGSDKHLNHGIVALAALFLLN